MKKICTWLVLFALLSAMFATGAFAASMVTTGNVYMRYGPGIEYAHRFVLKKGTKVETLDSDHATDGRLWYKVKAKGKTGWVSSRYLTGGETVIGTVKMRSGNSFIRTKPSIYAKKLGIMYKGDSAGYIDTDYDSRGVLWYKVQLDGITGWVSSKYTKKAASPATQIYANGDSYIRKTYDISSKHLDILYKGESAKYLGVSRYDNRSPAVLWYKVEYYGTIGWVSSKYTVKKQSRLSPQP